MTLLTGADIVYATKSQYMSKPELQQLLLDLRARGCRLSASREALLTVVAKAKQPLSAAAIIKSAAIKRTGSDRATVYRALAFWEREGVIESLRLEGDERLYHLNLHHHHHLVCTACQQVFSVHACQSLRKTEAEITRATGFQVQRHVLEFYGLCHRCVEKNK